MMALALFNDYNKHLLCFTNPPKNQKYTTEKRRCSFCRM